MGRFINADAFVSTGQGLLGSNMFAYCLNNPIVRVDSLGTASIIPLPTLRDYYHMHKAVQYDIAEEYGFGIEVFVVGSLGIGRLDLYDGENNQYYEVKHTGAAKGTLFEDQMKKYDASHVAGWRFSEYSDMGNVSKGTTIIYGKTTYEYWDIYYNKTEDGLIVYSWKPNKERYEQYVASTLTVCGVAMVGYCVGFGGAKSGSTKPLPKHTALAY